MAFDDGQHSQPQAGFDMALATLQRINLELYHCNESQRQGAIDNWWHALLNLYKEANNFLPDNEKQTHLNHKKDCATAFESWVSYQNTYASTPKEKRGLYKPPQDVFHKLMDWELLLRSALDKAGVMMKKGKDWQNIMEGR